MNFFDKNRNDLSKYFYDLSKTVLLSALVVPALQKQSSLKMSLVGTLIAVIVLVFGMIVRKDH